MEQDPLTKKLFILALFFFCVAALIFGYDFLFKKEDPLELTEVTDVALITESKDTIGGKDYVLDTPNSTSLIVSDYENGIYVSDKKVGAGVIEEFIANNPVVSGTTLFQAKEFEFIEQGAQFDDLSQKTYAEYRQMYRGVPVYGAYLSGVVDNNRLVALNGSWSKASEDQLPGALDKSDLMRATDELLASQFTSPNIKSREIFLIDTDLITGLNAPRQVGYGEVLTVLDSSGQWEVITIGNRVLSKVSVIHEANIFALGEDELPASNETGSSVVSISMAGGSGGATCNSLGIECVRVSTCDGEPRNRQNCQVQATNLNQNSGIEEVDNLFRWSANAWNYFSREHNWVSPNGQTGAAVESLDVNLFSQCWEGNGAHYLDPYIEFCPSRVSEDVMVHEYSHAVFARTAGTRPRGRYELQASSVNEGLADIFATAADQDGDWAIYNSPWWFFGGYAESVDMGSPDGTIFDFYSQHQPEKLTDEDYVCPIGEPTWENDHHGIHINGTILGHAAYLMSEGGNFNGIQIEEIGQERTFEIHFLAMKNLLRRGQNFHFYYHNLKGACAGRYGESSDVCRSVDAALRAVELDQQREDSMAAPQCNLPSVSSCSFIRPRSEANYFNEYCLPSEERCEESKRDIVTQGGQHPSICYSSSPDSVPRAQNIRACYGWESRSGKIADCHTSMELCQSEREFFIDRPGITECMLVRRDTASPDAPSPARQASPTSPTPTPEPPAASSESSSTTLDNPIPFQTIWQLFDKIMDIIVMLAIPVIVIFVILAGFKFVIAGGNQEKISGAKKTLAYVVIGTIIILSAKVLTAILSATVNGIVG